MEYNVLRKEIDRLIANPDEFTLEEVAEIRRESHKIFDKIVKNSVLIRKNEYYRLKKIEGEYQAYLEAME